MQLVCLDADDGLVERISRSLRVAHVPNDSFPHPAACVLIVAPDLALPEVQAHLKRLDHEDPVTPIVLITNADGDNLNYLGRLRADRVIAIEEIEARLPTSVQGLLDRDPLEAMATEIENAKCLHTELGHVLTAVLRANPPMHSENRIATVARLKPWRVWELSSLLVDRTGWRLLDVMHATTLLRIGLLRPHFGGVAEALRQLRVAKRSAQRWSQALFGVELNQLAEKPDAVEHPIVQAIPSAKDLPSPTAQDWLRTLGARLVSAQQHWQIGQADGPPGSTFGNIVDVAISPMAEIHVLDQLYNEVLIYSRKGEFTGAFGREGSGPGEFRHPMAIDFFPDGRLALAAAGQIVILRNDSIPPTLHKIIPQGDRIPPVQDLCEIDGRLFVRPRPSTFERSIYAILPVGDSLMSFGQGYPHGDRITRTQLSVGNIACIPALNLVITTFQYVPIIQAFRPDGRVLWTAQLSAFDPLSFFEIRNGDRVRFRTNRSEPGDLILNVVPVRSTAALLQVAHLTGAQRTPTGRSFQHISGIDSYLLDATTGEGIALGQTLPRINAVRDDAFYAVRTDSLQGFLRLAAYRYDDTGLDHEDERTSETPGG